MYHTGASSGIGAATSVLFAKLGAKVSLTGRSEENLQKTAKECETHGAKVSQSKTVLSVTYLKLSEISNMGGVVPVLG